jgi:lysophospholipase L1-like esterase
MTRAPSTHRTWRRRLAVLACATAASLFAAEIVARVVVAYMTSRQPAAPRTGSEVPLSYMVRPAAHPDIVYELQPGLDCVFQGVPVRTNEHGWRGPAHPVTKPDHGLRILALGDSVLFGWGVEWEHTGVARLQARLRAALPDRVVEVLGTGVPGYNTAMQAAVLQHHGLPFAPDIVVVDFVANDLELPNFLLAPPDCWRLDRSFLLDLARRLRHSHWMNPWLPFEAAPLRGGGQYESDPERVPPAYRHLVGIDAYRRALRTILDIGRERGFRVLVATHYGLSPPVRAVCEELAVPVADCAARIDGWLRERGVAYLESELVLRADDPHPSPLLHDWWAEAVGERLRALRWLPE